MSNELELELLEKIAKLEKEILKLSGKTEKDEIPSFSYSKIKKEDLEQLFNLKRCFNKSIFNSWFDNILEIDSNIENFLNNLLEKERDYIQIYKEEDLKVKFISQIINFVDFKIGYEIRDFYEETLIYKTDRFIFNGTTDFLVSTGFERAEKPYFFIQEFKKGRDFSDPEPQLLAELIAGLELNNWQKIKGAYIIGAIWNFVILEKLGENSYCYYVSQNFDSTDILKLKYIYKNLLFIKNEIIKGVVK